MSRATIAAWGLWCMFLAVLLGAIYVGFNPPEGKPIAALDAVWAASFIGFPTAGAIVASRMPRRPLGWMLLSAPLLVMIGVGTGELTRFPWSEGAIEAWMLWVASVTFAVGLGVLVTIPLYLPNGQLPGRRWRWIVRGVWTLVSVMALHAAFAPGPLDDDPDRVPNPAGVAALRGLFDIIEEVVEPFALGIVILAIMSLFVRFRNSRGIERQQMKWLAVGGGGVLLSFASLLVLDVVLGVEGEAVTTPVLLVAILSLPASIAVAVMKTRLYDVDLVINRTLVYGALTAILGFAYLLIVVVLQRVLAPVAAESDLAIAASTLAVAALFRPLRGWVQTSIDRRFYRRKFDAAETLSAFSTRLRDQVDLETLRVDIVEVVHETMQPKHASLWLRSGAVE